MTKHDFSRIKCSFILISTCNIELLGTISIVLISRPDPEKTLHTPQANTVYEKRKNTQTICKIYYGYISTIISLLLFIMKEN